jgi:transposase
MRKERKHFTPEEKVAILRRHLVDKVPVSELCEELGLRPPHLSMRAAVDLVL